MQEPKIKNGGLLLRWKTTGFLLCLLFISTDLWAQNKEEIQELPKKKIGSYLEPSGHFEISIPVWIPGFAGEFAYGDISIEVEDGGDPGDPGDPGDDIGGGILSRLFRNEWFVRFFFLTKIEYSNGKFSTSLDAIAGSVGDDIKFNYNNSNIVESKFTSINVRWILAYRLLEHQAKNKRFKYQLHGYAGIRGHIQEVFLNINATNIQVNPRPEWVEPILGVKNKFIFNRWRFELQGDYGGLFKSDKYSTQYTGLLSYRSGNLTSIRVGWNHLSINHLGKVAEEDLVLNVTLSGPSMGIIFHF